MTSRARCAIWSASSPSLRRKSTTLWRLPLRTELFAVAFDMMSAPVNFLFENRHGTKCDTTPASSKHDLGFDDGASPSPQCCLRQQLREARFAWVMPAGRQRAQGLGLVRGARGGAPARGV